jgi:hypothetical protein
MLFLFICLNKNMNRLINRIKNLRTRNRIMPIENQSQNESSIKKKSVQNKRSPNKKSLANKKSPNKRSPNKKSPRRSPNKKSPRRSPNKKSPNKKSLKRSPNKRSPNKKKSPNKKSPRRSPNKKSPHKKKSRPCTYCGNNLLSPLLQANGGDCVIGTNYQCLKKGIGYGMNSPIDLEFINYEPIDQPENIYCGDKLPLPDKYERFGRRSSCLRKGVGVGKRIKIEREGLNV